MLMVVEGKGRRLTTSVLTREQLPKLLHEWQALSSRSADDNVYYSPNYALALLDTIDRDKKVEFITAWSGGRLVALWPFTRSRALWPGFGTAGIAWQTPYTFSCMPLLDRNYAEDAVLAILDAMPGFGLSTGFIPTINLKGQVFTVLTTVLDELALPWQTAGQFERAALTHGLSFEEHCTKHIGSKRRRDLARNRRKLSEQGKLIHSSHTAGAELEKAVAAFLEIESKGWKGERGTALASSPDSLQFAKSAFMGSTPDWTCRADVLSLEDKPIAVGLMVRAGRTGFTVKCTYDEDYRKFGAGLLLEEDFIRSFLTEKFADKIDSATNGGHVIDGLWPEKIEVGDLIFSASPRIGSGAFSMLMRIDSLRRASIHTLKNVRDRLLRRD
jgi:Acetyltransferase (GNAT) domain